MILAILQHTPIWVFVLFAILFRLGLQQTRERTVGLVRASLLPLAMVALSVSGIGSALGGTALAYACWGAGLALAVASSFLLGWRRSARYLPESRSFVLAGSWLPLAMMLLVFCTKYGVAVTLAMHPALRQAEGFVTSVGLVYGLFSGVFLSRAASLWLLALRHGSEPATA